MIRKQNYLKNKRTNCIYFPFEYLPLISVLPPQSSLCSKHDRESYAYQLYLAYQQYPQALLNAVLTRMRQDQMISYKKCYNRSQVAQTCLPLSTSPFQLSVTYHHVFNFKVSGVRRYTCILFVFLMFLVGLV